MEMRINLPDEIGKRLQGIAESSNLTQEEFVQGIISDFVLMESAEMQRMIAEGIHSAENEPLIDHDVLMNEFKEMIKNRLQ